MENNQRNSRKRLNSLILLVAFTAVMLIVSTYAWFSAQKNVTIGGLKGTVNVAEGLEISLDAKYWSQEVNFGDYTNQWDLKKLYGATEGTAKDGELTASDPNHNIIPTELLPVSTTGLSAAQIKEALSLASAPANGDGIGETDMNFYRGINQNGSELYDIITVQKVTGDGTTKGDLATTYTEKDPTGATTTPLTSGYHDYPGYYAIDLFLRNSTSEVSTSKITDGASVFDKVNALQLNANSKLELQSSSANSTGLQNTVRVAFALYNMDETYDVLDDDAEGDPHYGKSWNDVLSGFTKSAYMTASQKQILAAYAGQTINDVAIWEPNASDHAQQIVDTFRTNSLMKIQWKSADQTLYGIPTEDNLSATPKVYKDKFGVSTPLPTYALAVVAKDLTQTDGDDTGTDAGDSDTDTNTVKIGEGTSVSYVEGIQDIYDWKTPSDGLVKQVTLQTEKSSTDNYATGKVKQLVSVTADNTKRYTMGTEDADHMFSIPKGKVCKVRMYVWLEGQDPDTINHASHGGGIYLDVGLLKDGTAQS